MASSVHVLPVSSVLFTSAAADKLCLTILIMLPELHRSTGYWNTITRDFVGFRLKFNDTQRHPTVDLGSRQ
jgi:hypothetical protein